MPIVPDTAPPAPSRFPLLAIVSVLAFAAACHRSPALTREYALQALAANKHFIVAAHHRSLGITLIGAPDPQDTTFKVDHLVVTGITQSSDSSAVATFTADIIIQASGNTTAVNGEARFRLFDDGWRLDPNTITAKS